VLDRSSAWLALEVRALGVSQQPSTPCLCQYEHAFSLLIAVVGAYAIHSPWYSPKQIRKSCGSAGGERGWSVMRQKSRRFAF
jgi:hypothetical protein